MIKMAFVGKVVRRKGQTIIIIIPAEPVQGGKRDNTRN
jgi:hypothetical protein